MGTDNEDRCCDAALRVIEERAGRTRSGVSRPDDEERNEKRVDCRALVGNQEYALEHTLLETFVVMRLAAGAFKEFTPLVQDLLVGQLSADARYELLLPQTARLGGKRQWPRTAERLARWVAGEAGPLRDRLLAARLGGRGLSVARALPELLRVRRPVTLWGWLTDESRGPALPGFDIVCSVGPDLASLQSKALQKVMREKLPKLRQTRDEGARTVLVLEMEDFQLGSPTDWRVMLDAALAEREDAPDEVYLAQTGIASTWYLWAMNSATEYRFPSDFPNVACRMFETSDLGDPAE